MQAYQEQISNELHVALIELLMHRQRQDRALEPARYWELRPIYAAMAPCPPG